MRTFSHAFLDLQRTFGNQAGLPLQQVNAQEPEAASSTRSAEKRAQQRSRGQVPAIVRETLRQKEKSNERNTG